MLTETRDVSQLDWRRFVTLLHDQPEPVYLTAMTCLRRAAIKGRHWIHGRIYATYTAFRLVELGLFTSTPFRRNELNSDEIRRRDTRDMNSSSVAYDGLNED